MSRFETCLPYTLSEEGGYSDNPADPGGPTNLGITLADLSAWRGHPCTADDVRALTETEAAAIYERDYWLPLRCDAVPVGLDLALFDAGVNCGVGWAIRALQGCLVVPQDGAFGPVTQGACQKADLPALINGFCSARIDHYRSLPTFDLFGDGWLARTNRIRSAALSMI